MSANLNKSNTTQSPLTQPIVPVISNQNNTSKTPLSDGSLLRLFKSSFFDAWMAVSYLYKYPHPGVHDYLSNQLYALANEDIEFYLTQLCMLLVYQPVESDALERFILDKCAQSLHFALKVAWIFQAFIEDEQPPVIRERCLKLREDVEIATVNSRRLERKPRIPPVNSLSPVVTPRNASENSFDLHTSLEEGKEKDLIQTQNINELDADFNDIYVSKKDRAEYFDQIQKFMDEQGNIAERLKKAPIPQRQKKLEEEMLRLNDTMIRGNTDLSLYIPIWPANRPHFCIVRIPPDECRVLNSRERVPYLMVMEVLESVDNVKSSDAHLERSAINLSQVMENTGKKSS